MTLFPLESEPDSDDGFEVFWSDYPRKEAKVDARKAWRQGKHTRATAHAIQDALQWQTQQKNWQESKRYIPLPASYIRGERWKDEKIDAPKIAAHRLTPFEQARRAGLK